MLKQYLKNKRITELFSHHEVLKVSMVAHTYRLSTKKPEAEGSSLRAPEATQQKPCLPKQINKQSQAIPGL